MVSESLENLMGTGENAGKLTWTSLLSSAVLSYSESSGSENRMNSIPYLTLSHTCPCSYVSAVQVF